MSHEGDKVAFCSNQEFASNRETGLLVRHTELGGHKKTDCIMMQNYILYSCEVNYDFAIEFS